MPKVTLTLKELRGLIRDYDGFAQANRRHAKDCYPDYYEKAVARAEKFEARATQLRRCLPKGKWKRAPRE